MIAFGVKFCLLVGVVSVWWFCDIMFIVDDVVVLILVSVCWLFFVIGVCVVILNTFCLLGCVSV